MPNKIATIGLEIPSDGSEFVRFESKVSLLDYDISIFNPSITRSYEGHENYLGKPCLNDYYSFTLKEQIEHWRQEILEAVKAGKTVFVLMNSLQEVYIATGEKSYDGTGRNRTTNRIVTSCSNYNFIPGGVNVRASLGTAMRLLGKDNILTTYWTAFGQDSEYRVLIDSDLGKKLVVTNAGQKTVGVRYRYDDFPGTLYMLPYLDFERDEFYKEDDDDELYWNDEAVAYGKQFLSAIVEIDKATQQEYEASPAPTWLLEDDNYKLPAKLNLQQKLLQAETQIELLQKKKEELLGKLSKETLLKGLLYEKRDNLGKCYY